MDGNENIRVLLSRIGECREKAGLTPQDIDRELLLGPGWTEHFERGLTVPSIGIVVAMLNVLGVSPAEFFGSHVWAGSTDIPRDVYAVESDSGITIRFKYADHDAEYHIPAATLNEFRSIVGELQEGLARLVATDAEEDATALQTDAVARMFLKAVVTWPSVSPSDLWWFLVYRAYCDPFNHPASNARRDFGQSWKRTGGWALEEVLVRHYGAVLGSRGISLLTRGPRKEGLLRRLQLQGRIEVAKADVLLVGRHKGADTCFGVVHVKASFAERRTDDVPLSRALIEGGYVSPLWTMDCKGAPSALPVNKGELGSLRTAGRDARSAKRKDIEDDGEFSACFSYNSRTIPTPPDTPTRAKIVCCTFANPNDEFSRYVTDAWQRFKERQ